ncbi:hypothetical protein R3P38DRAFT_2770901 [Favolaschia claudopus]|uniref:Uncharacterized protein n=1 Tax=Favolaschia claudopus TaxID=2862362 RepID=A0AAW0CF46_9AGAR
MSHFLLQNKGQLLWNLSERAAANDVAENKLTEDVLNWTRVRKKATQRFLREIWGWDERGQSIVEKADGKGGDYNLRRFCPSTGSSNRSSNSDPSTTGGEDMKQDAHPLHIRAQVDSPVLKGVRKVRKIH